MNFYKHTNHSTSRNLGSESQSTWLGHDIGTMKPQTRTRIIRWRKRLSGNSHCASLTFQSHNITCYCTRAISAADTKSWICNIEYSFTGVNPCISWFWWKITASKWSLPCLTADHHGSWSDGMSIKGIPTRVNNHCPQWYLLAWYASRYHETPHLTVPPRRDQSGPAVSLVYLGAVRKLQHIPRLRQQHVLLQAENGVRTFFPIQFLYFLGAGVLEAEASKSSQSSDNLGGLLENVCHRWEPVPWFVFPSMPNRTWCAM